MRLFFLLFTVFFTFNLLASNYESRIIITKTKNQSTLYTIQQKLTQLGYKIYFQKYDNTYYVYSPVFHTQKETKQALQKIKTFFPYAKILQNENNNHQLRISLAPTYSKITTSRSTENAQGIETTLAYQLSPSFNIGFSYLYLSSNLITSNNGYFTFKYIACNSNKFTISGGLIGGYGSLKLKEYTDSTASTSLLYGLDISIGYKITQNFHTSFSYKPLWSDYVINIADGETYHATKLHNMMIGFIYNF